MPPRFLLATTSTALLLSSCGAPDTFLAPEAELNQLFLEAADEFDVPRDLLVALAWTETRFDARPPGEASKEGGYGIMNLRGGEPGTDLARAASFLDLEQEVLKTDHEASIRGAAMLLRLEADDWAELNDNDVDEWAEWYEVTAERAPSTHSALRTSYARQVFHTMEGGVEEQLDDGGWIIIASQDNMFRIFL